MSKRSAHELADRIEKADIELFVLIKKIKAQEDRSKRFYTLMTSLLAIVAGLSISLATYLPELNKTALLAISVACGALFSFVSFVQHNKEKRNELSKLLKEYELYTEVEKNEAEVYRRSLINELNKEGEYLGSE